MWGRGKGCRRNGRSYHSLRIYVRGHPRNANVLSSMIPSTRNLKNMILSDNKPSGLGMTVTPKTQFPDKQRTLQITQWSQRCFLETGFHHLWPDDLTGKWNCTKCSFCLVAQFSLQLPCLQQSWHVIDQGWNVPLLSWPAFSSPIFSKACSQGKS